MCCVCWGEGLVDEYLSVQINVLAFMRKYKGVKCETGETVCVCVCVECLQRRWGTTTVYGGAVHRLNTLQLGAAAKPGSRDAAPRKSPRSKLN